MKILDAIGRHIAPIIAFFCALAFALCAYGWYSLSHMLPAQREFERWRGENSLNFGQISCYMPLDEKLSLNQVYEFRGEIQKRLKDAALDAESGLYTDAWCTFGKVNAAAEHGNGQVSVTAVGGNFFSFHPLTLISGTYIGADDLMKDRVMLDEETAWLLFGGRDLAGMSMTIEGKPFVVAGVISRETDSISEKAYTSGMGIYMSYEAFMRLNEEDGAEPSTFFAAPGISCYELTMAEPVSGLSYSLAQEKFPIKGGMLVNNARRYTVPEIFKILRAYGTRSMQTQGVILPYWENAARSTEDWCALLLVACVLTGVYPLIFSTRTVLSGTKRVANRLGAAIPDKREKLEEAIRIRQRRRWERKHPGWK